MVRLGPVRLAAGRRAQWGWPVFGGRSKKDTPGPLSASLDTLSVSQRHASASWRQRRYHRCNPLAEKEEERGREGRTKGERAGAVGKRWRRRRRHNEKTTASFLLVFTHRHSERARECARRELLVDCLCAGGTTLLEKKRRERTEQGKKRKKRLWTSTLIPYSLSPSLFFSTLD